MKENQKEFLDSLDRLLRRLQDPTPLLPVYNPLMLPAPTESQPSSQSEPGSTNLSASESVTSSTQIKDILDPLNRQEAINFLSEGEVVGVQIDGTFGLIAPGTSSEIAQRINIIKGRNFHLPLTIFASISTLTDIVPHIDPVRINPEYQPLVQQPRALYQLTSQCVTRIPIQKAAASIKGTPIHDLIISSKDHSPIIQVFSPRSQPSVNFLEEAEKEVGLLVISSMNSSGCGTISNKEKAIDFCISTGIPILLLDSEEPERSYRIAVIDQDGINEHRTGKGRPVSEIVAQIMLGLVQDQQLYTLTNEPNRI